MFLYMAYPRHSKIDPHDIPNGVVWEGYRASRRGQDISECPFITQDDKAHWISGWNSWKESQEVIERNLHETSM
jgi:ribosome modulation factor